MPNKQLKERYVVYIKVQFHGEFIEWYGNEYETYPTAEQIVDCLEKFTQTDETRILYARVEKQYRLV